MKTHPMQLSALVALSIGIASCDENDPRLSADSNLLAITQATSGTQELIAFGRQSPGTITQKTLVTGLASGDSIIGLDVRPADNILIILTRNSTTAKLYTVNPSSGVATSICTLVSGATGMSTSVALGASDNYGADFNPTALGGNALRVVSSAGQNLRVETRPGMTLGMNVAGASECATSVDGSLNTVAAGASTTRTGISAAAYTNSVAGATATTLYYIDADEAAPTTTIGDRLAISTDPNGGLVGNVGGPLGPDISGINGFEIGGADNIVSLAAQIGSATVSTLFSVNLATGLATELGTIGGGVAVTGLTSKP